MRTFVLAAHLFAALLSALAILLTLNRIYLNQAADLYSDKEMLALLPSAAAFAFFTALTIRSSKDPS